MEKKPFTKQEAEKIAVDFQYLVGKQTNDVITYPITYVAAGPFNQQYLGDFISYHDQNEAFSDYDYVSPDGAYDVYVISWIGDSGNALQTDIRSFLDRAGISYSF